MAASSWGLARSLASLEYASIDGRVSPLPLLRSYARPP